jgi:hypothetical protein
VKAMASTTGRNRKSFDPTSCGACGSACGGAILDLQKRIIHFAPRDRKGEVTSTPLVSYLTEFRPPLIGQRSVRRGPDSQPRHCASRGLAKEDLISMEGTLSEISSELFRESLVRESLPSAPVGEVGNPYDSLAIS